MSVQAISWALRLDIPSTSTKFVLVALANYCGPKGTCFVGQERLARDTSLSVRAVRGALSSLEAEGIISRERRNGIGGHRTSDRIRLNASYRKILPVGNIDQPEDISGSEEEWDEDDGNMVQPANHDRPTGKSRPSNRQDLPGNRKLTVREPLDTRCAREPKSKKKPSYTDEFEEFWNEVPKPSEDDRANPGSKSDAFKAWQRLDEADRTALFSGWQDYLGWLEKQRAKRAEYPIKQFVTFINGRLWETYQLGAA